MPKRHVKISISAVIVTVLCWGLAPLRAEENSAAEVRRQAELFMHQYDSVLKQIQKIPEDAKQLDEALKKDRDPADIKEFRKALSDALSVLADNGSLETFTKSYIHFLEERLRTDQEDTHYSEAQKKIAVDGRDGDQKSRRNN